MDWYADETGFHPTLAHLPKVDCPSSHQLTRHQPVEPDHPEVAAAVAAQLAAAAGGGYSAEPG